MLGWHHLHQRLHIIGRHAGIQLPEDGDSASEQLHDHASGIARSGAHGAKDWQLLELGRTVCDDVLPKLHPAHARGALHDNNTAVRKWAVGRRLYSWCVGGDDRILLRKGLIGRASKHLRHLGHGTPLADRAKVLHLFLAISHRVLRSDIRAIDGIVVPGEADLPLNGKTNLPSALPKRRLEDVDSIGFTLDFDGRQSLEEHLARGVLAGLLVGQNAQGRCVGHKTSRQVNTVSQNRVLHSLCTTTDTTIASASGHTEASYEIHSLEDLRQLHRG
mmetsp:Transcript_90427/g.163067  ORF Transcript_90427/g.163067 Transcript_90427/m.163067 type:complete len:275 (-) Transcript_90427:1328-2152(-)